MNPENIVSRDQWLEARMELLNREKALTRERDALTASRRALPWVKLEKEYVFETDTGKATLSELFGDRSQLIVYHFMFGPNGGRDVSVVRSGPTLSTASNLTSPAATSHLSPYPARP